MEPFSIDRLRAQVVAAHEPFVEFLREDSLSMEVYHLEAGATDPQEPHTEDEVYFIVDGRATLRIEDQHHLVEPGDIAFVRRGVDHAFVDIAADLFALVFFTPPSGSLAA